MSSSNNRGGVSASPSVESQKDSAEKQTAVSPAAKKFMTEAEKFQAVKEELSKKKGPLHVVATRPGFYKGMRRSEGDKFTIESVEEFGKWMKLI